MPSTLVSPPVSTVCRSRWGWHPCDFETLLKLRAIASEYHRAAKEAAAFARWERKECNNRVRRARRRDSAGRPIGHGEAVPVDRPCLTSPLFHLTMHTEWVDRSGRPAPHGVTRHRSIPRAAAALAVAAYRAAKRPAPLPGEVEPLPLTLGEIDRLYRMLRRPHRATPHCHLTR